MIKYHQLTNEVKIAELTDKTLIFNDVQTAIDIIADVGFNNCNRLIIYDLNLPPEFFELKTKLAGEILQKFSNYRTHLAIIGDYKNIKSKSLNDFIAECNRGRQIVFTDSLENAINKLSNW